MICTVCQKECPPCDHYRRTLKVPPVGLDWDPKFGEPVDSYPQILRPRVCSDYCEALGNVAFRNWYRRVYGYGQSLESSDS